MTHQRVLVVASAGILFLYFFLRPDVDYITSALIFGMWTASMMLDLQITFANESYIPRYERSLVLSFVYGKFSRNLAMLFVVMIESFCVMLMPAIIVLDIDVGASIAIAYFFALLHIVATNSNETFVRRSIPQ